MVEKINILYLYLQRRLLEAANNIDANNGRVTQDKRFQMIEDLKSQGKLNTEINFADVKKLLRKSNNLPFNITIVALYAMQDLELLKIEGKYNHMKVRLINIHKGRFIEHSNKIYKICF